MPRDECRVCGQIRELTFEHIPPRSAYNSDAVQVLDYDDWTLYRAGAEAGSLQHGGTGECTLCAKCNNQRIGSRYGTDYVDWVVDIKRRLDGTSANPGAIVDMEIRNFRPLRILKHVIAFMLCGNSPEWGQHRPELRDFVKRRDSRELPDKYGVYMFLTLGGVGRSVGNAGVLNHATGHSYQASEVTFNPCGFILVDGAIPNDQLQKINHFNEYAFDRTTTLTLHLPVYEINTIFPCDFRTQAEIERDRAINAGGNLGAL